MGWMFALGILVLPLAMTHSSRKKSARSPRVSESVQCAASFSDAQWKVRSIRQFQELRMRTDELVKDTIGKAANGRYFIFGENSTTTILFVSRPECLKAAKSLDEARLFSKRGRVVSLSAARAEARTLLQEE